MTTTATTPSSSAVSPTPITLGTAAPIPPARNIFEYLTTKNPDVVHQTAGKSLTANPKFITPKRVKPWHEFNFSTIEEIFDKQLMRECMRPRLMHHIYPPPSSRNLIEKDEDSTIWILQSWTIPMVNAALETVGESLNPVFWAARSLGTSSRPSVAPSESSMGRTPTKTQPGRQAKKKVVSSERRRKSKSFIPDGGGLPFSSLSTLQAGKGAADILPKEIKPGTKWTSEDLALGKLVDENGEWLKGAKWQRPAAPLRQIYTYCVQAKSRYGCIVTSKEVLAIRIRAEELVSDLDTSMREHGLMEWKSIKWSAHREEGEPEEYRELTMNMALWILHVLAGNDHDIKEAYNPLKKEKVKRPPPTLPPSPVSTIAFSATESEQPQ
ncbi:hypothetical protein F4802DRAFT_359759 [Xylaria palmicola]|nr:hypothetical protein F4802DRAFT_359759 [Xylaria palmicola]